MFIVKSQEKEHQGMMKTVLLFIVQHCKAIFLLRKVFIVGLTSFYVYLFVYQNVQYTGEEHQMGYLHEGFKYKPFIFIILDIANIALSFYLISWLREDTQFFLFILVDEPLRSRSPPPPLLEMSASYFFIHFSFAIKKKFLCGLGGLTPPPPLWSAPLIF